jgi:molybdate transport system substrate-binding protein
MVLLLAPVACGTPTGEAEHTQLVVFAASSLAGPFEAIASSFEASHPGLEVLLNFGPSDTLAGQIASEGTADVFASASPRWMDEVAAAPGVRGRVDFANNRLVVVTPSHDQAGIASIEQLAEPGVQVVLAAEGVPVGDYAREVLANAGILDAVLSNVVSNEEDAAGVVAKVSSGEADAALVYVSDVSSTAGDDLRALPIPDDINVVATYPIAVVEGSPSADLGMAFIELVTGPEGQQTLQEHGFEPIG